MTDDQIIKLVNELTPVVMTSVKGAIEHTKPSPVTEKFMEESIKDRATLRESFMEQKFEIKEIRNDQKEMKETLLSIHTKIDAMDGKFSGKWVERAVWSFIALVMTALGGAWLLTIIK